MKGRLHLTISNGTLRAAAAAFLAQTDMIAWEPGHYQRTVATLQLQAGDVDAAALRAALGVGERSSSPRPSTGQATALLSLTGVLMAGESLFSLLGLGTSVRTFMQQLAAAGADPAVRSIVIAVDSPGGSVRMIPEAAQLMRSVRMHKPVVAAVTGMCCSAAYWIAANATRIESTLSGEVGSIGVVTERVSIARKLQQDGIDVDVIHAGLYKSEGHLATVMSADERAEITARVDGIYLDFLADVAGGRHVSAATVSDQYGQGRVVPAGEALRRGMLDAIATTEATLARTVSAPAQLAALERQRVALARVAREPFRLMHVQLALREHRRLLAAAGRR